MKRAVLCLLTLTTLLFPAGAFAFNPSKEKIKTDIAINRAVPLSDHAIETILAVPIATHVKIQDGDGYFEVTIPATIVPIIIIRALVRKEHRHEFFLMSANQDTGNLIAVWDDHDRVVYLSDLNIEGVRPVNLSDAVFWQAAYEAAEERLVRYVERHKK